MEIISPIHGRIIYEEKDIITFDKGIPGFEHYKKYVIREAGDNDSFYILQSIEEKELGFILISPFLVYEDYEVKLKDEIIKKLDIKSSEEVLLYSVVTLNNDIKEITANLKAPIVINIKNKKGEQYITDNNLYKIKEIIF